MAGEGAFRTDRAAGATRSGRRPTPHRQRRGDRTAQRRTVNRSLERKDLRGPVLRSVSRSFYLSLRILPAALREPLSLAYLLARATDTIADTPEPPVALRLAALGQLEAAIQGTAARETAAQLRESFARVQSNEAERTLIEQLPALLEWLDELHAGDREEVRRVLAKINRGQA